MRELKSLKRSRHDVSKFKFFDLKQAARLERDSSEWMWMSGGGTLVGAGWGHPRQEGVHDVPSLQCFQASDGHLLPYGTSAGVYKQVAEDRDDRIDALAPLKWLAQLSGVEGGRQSHKDLDLVTVARRLAWILWTQRQLGEHSGWLSSG